MSEKKLAHEWDIQIDTEFATVNDFVPGITGGKYVRLGGESEVCDAAAGDDLPAGRYFRVLPSRRIENEPVSQFAASGGDDGARHRSSRSLLMMAAAHVWRFPLREGIIYDFLRLDQLPRRPAVYIVVSRCLVLYVGKAKNPRSRWGSHHRHDECRCLGAESVIVIEAMHDSDLPEMELTLIRRMSPILNEKGINREGRKC